MADIKLALDKPMTLILTPVDAIGGTREGTDPEFFSSDLDVLRVTPLASHDGFSATLQPFGLGTCNLSVGCATSGGDIQKNYIVEVFPPTPVDFTFVLEPV